MLEFRSAGHARSASPIGLRALLLAFVAGFIAVLLFHQPMLTLLANAGITQSHSYSLRPVGMLAIPQVISSAFWGGLWGIVLYVVSRRWQRNALWYGKALLFGMIFPTLVAWFVVAALKGLPMVAGYKFNGMLTGLCVNAAWGLGTAILFRLLQRSMQAAPSASGTASEQAAGS